MNISSLKKTISSKHWYEAPPKIIQNIGDALQGFALFILGYVSLDNGDGLKWLAILGLFFGGLGVAMQKLFKNEA